MDTAITDGQKYFYEVAATNGAGVGAKSNASSATPTAPSSLPGAPQNLTYSAFVYISLSWSAPASNGGSPITGYAIYRGTSPTSEKLLTTVGNVTSYTDRTASKLSTFYYEVAAINAKGTGPVSNQVKT
jgi:fibronectin type 3 domain-containing protein